jgi:hypothetical protein
VILLISMLTSSTTSRQVRFLHCLWAKLFLYCITGRDDELALDYLKKAVEASDKYEAQSGNVVQGREKFDRALCSMLNAMAGLEQSEYGGASLAASMPMGSSEVCQNAAPRESCESDPHCIGCQQPAILNLCVADI